MRDIHLNKQQQLLMLKLRSTEQNAEDENII
jgi:hypothetical protein